MNVFVLFQFVFFILFIYLFYIRVFFVELMFRFGHIWGTVKMWKVLGYLCCDVYQEIEIF